MAVIALVFGLALGCDAASEVPGNFGTVDSNGVKLPDEVDVVFNLPCDRFEVASDGEYIYYAVLEDERIVSARAQLVGPFLLCGFPETPPPTVDRGIPFLGAHLPGFCRVVEPGLADGVIMHRCEDATYAVFRLRLPR